MADAPSQRSHVAGVLIVFTAAVGFSFKSILIKLAYVHPVDVVPAGVALVTIRRTEPVRAARRNIRR